MSWLDIAVTLPMKQTQRIDCPHCHGSKTAGVTNMGQVFTFHCFRCKEKESKPAPPMTPQERRALEKAAQDFKDSPPTLPPDFTEVIPTAGLLWLFKGGLNHEDISRFGFGYSPKMRRVIMPVYSGERLVAVQARSVYKDVYPKYLGQIVRNPRPVFKARKIGGSDTLVLTEDMLSACRVSKVTDAWSLLGTNLMAGALRDIGESGYSRVALWMDGDEAGINARRKMRRQLEAVGINAHIIRTDKDPKKYGLSEIEGLIT